MPRRDRSPGAGPDAFTASAPALELSAAEVAAVRREVVMAVIRRIPRGRVATYGQIAALAGWPGRSRLVGKLLSDLEDGRGVPWHRVVNARGEIAARDAEPRMALQRQLLTREGLVFNQFGRLDLAACQWRPRLRLVVAETDESQRGQR